ncbi:choice-of-anchor J domain-containing protein [Olleya sp. AH-315-F22]|nr:choice-of-anchor J domain-containing protein [Olleya sp. AH-315-F22]
MKKTLFLLAVVGALFVGCNPIEDIFDVIDAQVEPIVGSAEYTLTSEDYDELDLGFGSFSSLEDAKTILPDFISGLYPHFGSGSSVLMGYDLYIGSAEGVSDFTGADTYQLTTADYATSGSDAFGFYPDVDPDDFIPGVLGTAIAGPVDGDIMLAKYDQYFNDPVVGLANVVFYDFAAGFEGWVIVEESGVDEVWTVQTGNVRGNGFFGDQFANVEWLVSPTVDLTGESNLKFQITQELDFAGDTSLLKILVSTDYSGDVLTATWDEITLANPATGTMAPSEDYDFSAYDGETINVAFKYTSLADDPATVGVDEGDAGRWRIASLAIKTLGVTGDANNKGDFYVYDGDWEQADDVYYLSKADYDSMGENSGEPGRFNNFSSSTPADAYIPTFLTINDPFAFGQEEDRIIVVYKYFSTSCFCTQTRGNAYTVIDGEWTPHSSVISTTLQFGHDGNSWVPDNTIRYTLTGADISFISGAFSTIYPGPADNVGFFGSFDRRPSSSNYWSDDMLLEAFNALLDNNDPSAQEGQKYVLTFVTYIGSLADESQSVIKTGGVWVYQ